MKLILAGKYQFGEEFAWKHFGPGRTMSLTALLDNNFASEVLHRDNIKFVNNMSEFVEDCLSFKKDPLSLLELLIQINPDVIIITDEIGNGLIPLDRKDRNFRELVGNINKFLASISSEVYKVSCGIGVQLK